LAGICEPGNRRGISRNIESRARYNKPYREAAAVQMKVAGALLSQSLSAEGDTITKSLWPDAIVGGAAR